MRYLRAFGAFWYDFLVGDRPELFIGPIVLLTVVWIAVHAGVGDLAAAILMIVGVCAVGLVSLGLVLRTRR
jgi:hypothetical protein